MNVSRVVLGKVISDPVVQQASGTARTATDDPLGRGVPGFIDAIIHGHTRCGSGKVEFDSGRALMVGNHFSEDSFENRAGSFGETVLPWGFDASVPNLSSVAFAPGDELIGSEFGTEIGDKLSRDPSPGKPEPVQGVRDGQGTFVVKNSHVVKSGSAVNHVQGPNLLVVGGFQLDQVKMNDITKISGLWKLAASTNVFPGLFETNVAFQVLGRSNDLFPNASKAESTSELLIGRMSERFVTTHQRTPECRVAELTRGCFRFFRLRGSRTGIRAGIRRGRRSSQHRIDGEAGETAIIKSKRFGVELSGFRASL